MACFSFRKFINAKRDVSFFRMVDMSICKA
jgi:hypothetical protein